MNTVLHALLEQAVDKYPDRLAVKDRGRELTYLELEQAANRIAHLLVSRGVRRGDRVGLYLDKSLEAVVGIYGVLKAGGAYVPIDARAPTARAGYIAGNCQVKTLISSRKQGALWQSMIENGPPIQTIIVMDGAVPAESDGGPEILIPDDDLPRERLPTSVVPDDLAYILYTSGSTGQPKGVMLSHGNGVAFVEWSITELGLSPEDRLSSHAPFHFDLSIFDLFAAAGAGASVSLVPPATSVFPVEVARFIRDNQISIWYSVPSILSLLIQNAPLAQGDLRSLRAVVFAGEVFPSKFLSLLMKKLPHVEFHNWYGPTETNVCTSYRVDFAPDPLGPDIPIGKAIKGVDTFVITADGRQARTGEEGELLVGGPTVMKGYWGDPEKTASRLVTNPLEPLSPALVYKTGDLVVQEPDGNYRFLGRTDHQIKSRGYRIELGEIETAINSHPDVVECVVVAIPDEIISNRIEAHVVLNGEPNPDTLTTWCLARLPRYMIPESFKFTDTLPKTSTGKIDRQAVGART